MARRNAAVPRGPFHATPVFAARADGAFIEDVDGNRLLTLPAASGAQLGHRAPRVVAAVREQLEKFCTFVSALRRTKTTLPSLKIECPGAGQVRKENFYCLNTGAEAVENSIKIARAYTKRRSDLLKTLSMAARWLTIPDEQDASV